MRWIQKGYEDIMGDEERDLEGKVNPLSDTFSGSARHFFGGLF